MENFSIVHRMVAMEMFEKAKRKAN